MNGWDVFHFGNLCVCSRVWTAPNNAYITSSWGVLYESSESFSPPDYPVRFASIPSSHVSYIDADHGASYAALVERSVNTSTTNVGDFWLCRPDSGATIGHPKFAIIAVGLV